MNHAWPIPFAHSITHSVINHTIMIIMYWCYNYWISELQFTWIYVQTLSHALTPSEIDCHWVTWYWFIIKLIHCQSESQSMDHTLVCAVSHSQHWLSDGETECEWRLDALLVSVTLTVNEWVAIGHWLNHSITHWSLTQSVSGQWLSQWIGWSE